MLSLKICKVQLGFCSIRAPISGRISMANVKVGNFVRQADTSPMATINQIAPVYVSFTVPQKNLPDIRKAIAAETATVQRHHAGRPKARDGQVTMIENTVDPATGMATVRASMPNQDELLWPGTLVTAEMTLRIEDGVVVPANCCADQPDWQFVFVIQDGVAQGAAGQSRTSGRQRKCDRVRSQWRRNRRDRRPVAAVERHPRQHAHAEGRGQLIHEHF